ncbi:MAG: gamma-glutamyl-gamma-aminobutyrate hydrolase family protein [Pseudomonadota bacterium]|nr:gamma-glutamyl-gamma-aminobutyrate hydrolase family protein [Pseudomonadota bacterium]
MTTLPIVLVPACNRILGGHPFHIAGRKYVEAVRLAGALPLVAPRLEPHEFEAALDLAHGVLLTGSPSNVHPSNFGQNVHDPSLPLDPERDDWTLALIPQLLERGMPLLAICRGSQELNVALGGSLHQAVQEVPGYQDHRDDPDAPIEVQYGPAHEVAVVDGGLLQRITGRGHFTVNSLHGQGVARLAAGLRVEATAQDGLVEAFSVTDAPGFALAVQWHPEWQAADNPVSMALLRAFGQATLAYRERRKHP